MYGITEPTVENMLDLKARLIKEGKAANTIRLYLVALKYWAAATGLEVDKEYKKKMKVKLPKSDHPPCIPFEQIKKVKLLATTRR